MDISQLLTLLLGGGFVATVTALFNGVKSLREGSRSRERDTISDLINGRKEAEHDRDRNADERDMWRNWAGRLEYGLLQNGVDLPPGRPIFADEVRDDEHTGRD